jgi:hypothetical protein
MKLFDEIKKLTKELLQDSSEKALTQKNIKSILDEKLVKRLTRDNEITEKSFNLRRNDVTGIMNQKTRELAGTISEDLIKTIKRGQVKGLSDDEINEKVGKRLNLAKHQVQTITSTVKRAVTQASKIKDALDSGTEYFKYMGSSGNARAFCRDNLGKIYHIADIRKMVNGQALSVEYYCGGYNCRHSWEAYPVVKEDGVFIPESVQAKINIDTTIKAGTGKDNLQELRNYQKLFKINPNFFQKNSVEYNPLLKNKKGSQTDILINGQQFEVKKRNTYEVNPKALNSFIANIDGKQSDNYLIDLATVGYTKDNPIVDVIVQKITFRKKIKSTITSIIVIFADGEITI